MDNFNFFTFKISFTLVQVMKPQRGTTDVAVSLTWALERGWMVKATPRPLYPRDRNPVSDVQEAWWTSRLFWTGAVNHAPTGIWSPVRSTRRKSLYLPKEIITGNSETKTTGEETPSEKVYVTEC